MSYDMVSAKHIMTLLSGSLRPSVIQMRRTLHSVYSKVRSAVSEQVDMTHDSNMIINSLVSNS